MLRQRRFLALMVLVTVCSISLSIAQEKSNGEKTDEKKPASSAKVHTVKSGPLRIHVELKGVVEAKQSQEIVVRPKVWTSFTVQRAVAHGTEVKKGDQLVWLDTKKIDLQVGSVSRSLKIAELTLRKSKADLDLLKQSLPLDLKSAAQAKEVAEDSLKFYLKTGKKQSVESAEFSLQSARYQLEYAQEELDQLEKMYKADDLTEETEEIVLKRARRSVEISKRYLKNAEISTVRRLTKLIPREEREMHQAATRASLSFDNARTSLTVALKTNEFDLAKSIIENEQLQEQLDNLKADRAAMIIRAERDGIVYYGRSVRGKWLDKSKVDAQLRAGGALTPNQVILTVVAPRPVCIRADLAEKDLSRISKGSDAAISAVAFPNDDLRGKVSMVSAIPVSTGNFDCRIDVASKSLPSRLMPGMACSAKLVVVDKDEAISVPKAAVISEGGKSYVRVVKEDGSHEKRVIEKGQFDDSRVEVLEGLKDGEKVQLGKPEGKNDE